MACTKHERFAAAAATAMGASPDALARSRSTGRTIAFEDVGRSGMDARALICAALLMACGLDDADHEMPPDGIEVTASHTRVCIDACEPRRSEIVSLSLRSDAAKVVQIELHDWATDGRMLRQRSDPDLEEVELEPDRARNVSFSRRTDVCGGGDELPFVALVAIDDRLFEVEGSSFFYQDIEPCGDDGP